MHVDVIDNCKELFLNYTYFYKKEMLHYNSQNKNRRHIDKAKREISTKPINE